MSQYKYRKYQTKNPLVAWLIDSFFSRIEEIMLELNYKSLLDAGCGDGEALSRINHLLPDKVVGFDIDDEQINHTNIRFPKIKIEKQDICHLPYENNSFDLVLCLEVLEHLNSPPDALSELIRVSSKYLLLSVPHEPFFMIGNLLRGKNITSFGNDPEHIGHWNKMEFHKLLSEKVNVKFITHSFPWLIALCEK